jgi:putative adhesin
MQKMLPVLSVFGISALSFGFAACSIDVSGQGIVKREEKRFVVNGQADLTLHTFDGSIQLKSWDKNEVLVEIERRGPDERSTEALVVNATQDGNKVVVDVPAPRDRREGIHLGSWQSPSVSLIVTAPRKVNVEARTGDGSISADDLAGTVGLHSGDGSIQARKVEGSLRIRTGDGSIDVSDASGRVEADSGDGSIELSGRFEALDVRTGDGAVRVDVSDGSTLKTDWNVNTGDGSITVRLPRNLDAELDAHTGDGGVHANGLPVAAERNNDDDRDRESLRARIGNGGRTLRLRSGDGSIDISR